MRLTGIVVSWAVLLLSACARQPTIPAGMPDGEPLYLTHGVIVGDLDPDSAVIWARGNRDAELVLELSAEGSETGSYRRVTPVSAVDDFTSSLQLDGLRAATLYSYRLWLESGDTVSEAADGRFRTPQENTVSAPVRFAFSGDLGGQNVCRDLEHGYVILDVIAREKYDFFIGLGDMIYGDDVCLDRGGFGNLQVPGEFGPSTDLEGYRAHWRYNWADDAFQRLVAATPYYPLWDDHEVINNFGPRADFRDRPPYSRDLRLMPLGLQAYLEYNPLRRHANDPRRLYRDASWGEHLQLFFLDNRQYRDPNPIEDTEEQPKTMLGAAQKEWLKAGLAASGATWKVIVSSVPLSVPTGIRAETDGWADFDGETGFEHELRELLEFMRDEGIRNVVFITTDIHHATGFEYRPFPESPEFMLREFAVGPMSAAPAIWEQLDETFNPERLYLWGENRDNIDGFEGFRKIMNYGELSIDKEGTLTLRVIDGNGDVIFEDDYQPES